MSVLEGVTIQPTADRILVQRVEMKEQFRGSIQVPDTHTELPSEAVVLAVGPGLIDSRTGELRPVCVKKGDHILLPRFAGIEVILDADELLVIHEREMLGVISRASKE